MGYVFNVADHTGHTPHKFSEAQKEEASALFAKLVGPKSRGGQGMFAYANNGADQRQLRAFDDTVEETTFHQQLQGG